MGTVWILNLDAEAELERPRGYAPSRERLAQNRRHEEAAARGLLAQDDVIWREGEPALEQWRSWGARAWCPTPRALQRIRGAGMTPLGPLPTLEVLRRVNDRKFCAGLGQFLPGATFIERATPEEFGELERSAGEIGWLLKRSFGVAGRGRRKIRDLTQTTEADWNWIRASLKLGGLQVEPWCDHIEVEFVQEGVIDDSGEFRLGSPLVQHCASDGAWISCRRAGAELDESERSLLTAEGERVARALFAAGYSGPFALDAYRALFGNEERVFVARSEINARYSMGWSMGPPAD